MKPTCKKCRSGNAAKNGVVAGKQRFHCKECGCNFRAGDGRTNGRVAAKKAICILPCAMAKGSYRVLVPSCDQKDRTLVLGDAKAMPASFENAGFARVFKTLAFRVQSPLNAT